MDNNDKNGFVSRGGIKLQFAIENWKLNIENLTCLDVGSSTGGFVDVLLQNGANKVYSVDTAYGELAWTIRQDPRVVVMERTNILHLESLPEQVDLISIDAGWTKLELVLPVVKKFLKADGRIIALLKPHYEDPQKTVKGVILEELLEQVKQTVLNNIENLGFKVKNQIESPILGSNNKGNKEFLLLIV
jgi:23S rRNA (cytidine1920-2'-O)/16S rRNA (cytidine1409-2'-O)-methyltransferase